MSFIIEKYKLSWYLNIKHFYLECTHLATSKYKYIIDSNGYYYILKTEKVALLVLLSWIIQNEFLKLIHEFVIY